MAIKATKSANAQQIKMVLNGGLNYAAAPSNMQDNELRRANNFIYDPSTAILVSRPGTSCVTATVCDGANPITAMHHYINDAANAFLVASCNGNLYYLSGTAWVLIGALNDTSTTPSFLTFNSKLLIADGGAHIKTWDGTTFTTLATSPRATALAVIGNRVVCNATDEPDSVYLSKANDETDWDTTGSAVGVKAGFGDSLNVNGFGVFGDDLLIFKHGTSTHKIYRLNVADTTPSNWYVKVVASNSGAQNHQSVCEAWNNVFFVDSNGFKQIKGVINYGDLEIDPTGRKINSLFTGGASCDYMTYLPSYNAIWFGLGDRTLCYTQIPGSDGQIVPAFTDLTFKQGRIRCVCQAGDSVYMGGNDGFLYILDDSLATDATSYTTTASFTSRLRGKTWVFGGDGLLKKIQWYLRPKNAGLATLVVYTDEDAGTGIKTVTLPGSGNSINDATGYIADATGYIYSEGAIPWTETSQNRFRSPQLAFEILVVSGRVGVEWVNVEVALVEGGS